MIDECASFNLHKNVICSSSWSEPKIYSTRQASKPQSNCNIIDIMRVLFCNPNMLLRDRQQKMQYYYVGGARHFCYVGSKWQWIDFCPHWKNSHETCFAGLVASLSRTRVISRIITENWEKWARWHDSRSKLWSFLPNENSISISAYE